MFRLFVFCLCQNEIRNQFYLYGKKTIGSCHFVVFYYANSTHLLNTLSQWSEQFSFSLFEMIRSGFKAHEISQKVNKKFLFMIRHAVIIHTHERHRMCQSLLKPYTNDKCSLTFSYRCHLSKSHGLVLFPPDGFSARVSNSIQSVGCQIPLLSFYSFPFIHRFFFASRPNKWL